MAKTTSLQSQSRAESVSADSRAEGTLSAIKMLIQTLGPQDRERLLRDLGQMHAPQSGVVLTLVRKVLSTRANWTVAELKQQIDQSGVSVSAKDVYNALGYLTRKGQVTRVGYGQYLAGGGLFITADDLGGERGRHEDLSDDGPVDRAYRRPE